MFVCTVQLHMPRAFNKSWYGNFFSERVQRVVVKILTLREVVWASGLVVEHRDADVLEVFSPLCEALALQAASPQNQLALEQALHQVQALWM